MTFEWLAMTNVTWYDLSLHDSITVDTIFSQSHLADALACEGGTCSLELTISAGNYSGAVANWPGPTVAPAVQLGTTPTWGFTLLGP